MPKIILEFFSINVNSELYGIVLLQRLFQSCKNICLEDIWNESKSSTILCLNRGLLSNIWWLRSAKLVKFTEKCVMGIEKHVLVKKIFSKELNISLPLWVWVKKTVDGMEMNWLSGKEKDPCATGSKEDDADCSETWKDPSLMIWAQSWIKELSYFSFKRKTAAVDFSMNGWSQVDFFKSKYITLLIWLYIPLRFYLKIVNLTLNSRFK